MPDPAGGHGIDRVGTESWPLMLRGLLTQRDPKTCLSFTSMTNGRQAAGGFLKCLKECKVGRDRGPIPRAFLRQPEAIKAWGRQTPQDLARRNLHAQRVIYQDVGHGGIFQYHADFVSKALESLTR